MISPVPLLLTAGEEDEVTYSDSLEPESHVPYREFSKCA